jgi:hypothetical protein
MPGSKSEREKELQEEGLKARRARVRKSVQTKMQQCLDRLGMPLQVAWTQKPDRDKHGEIELGSRTLFLYDTEESEAWQTLLHEILEWKLKEVSKPYRETINGLIEIIERICYKRKEEFLEAIPNVFKAIEEAKVK